MHNTETKSFHVSNGQLKLSPEFQQKTIMCFHNSQYFTSGRDYIQGSKYQLFSQRTQCYPFPKNQKEFIGCDLFSQSNLPLYDTFWVSQNILYPIFRPSFLHVLPLSFFPCSSYNLCALFILDTDNSTLEISVISVHPITSHNPTFCSCKYVLTVSGSG